MELKLAKDTMIVSETDEKGVITYVNEEFCRFAKYTKDELIGQPHNIVRHPDMPKVAFKGLWDTIKTCQVWHGIVKNRAKNGDHYWVNATVFASKCTQGKKRYISVRVKPTDQEVAEAEALYKTLD
jgi:aerotaxis receptor